jgi:hypothetical protein
MQFTISSARLEPAAEAQVEDANRPDGRLEVPGNSRQTKLEHLQLTTGLSTPSASSPAFFSGFPAARASSAKKSSDSGCFFLRPRLALKTNHSCWRSSAQKLLSGAFSPLFSPLAAGLELFNAFRSHGRRAETEKSPLSRRLRSLRAQKPRRDPDRSGA